MHARVDVVSRLSGEATGQTVLENKIEITHDGKTLTFMWPDRTIYAAGRCEIADVDGDGKKELLLFDWAETLHGVRVVSYSHEQFRFRSQADELLSLGNTLEPINLGGNGHLEFVSERRFPKNMTRKVFRFRV